MGQSRMSSGALRALCVSAVLALAVSAAPAAGASERAAFRPGTVAAEGAFSCDFGLSAALPMAQVAPALERDRMFMARAAGPEMLRKIVPLSFGATGALAGGRYLFRTAAAAAAYGNFVKNDYVLDGVHFFDRPYFLNPDCHSWTVVGAHDFADVRTDQVVLRTERWRVPANQDRLLQTALQAAWPVILAEARRRGLTAVWLLYNRSELLVSLVYFDDRVGPTDPSAPDFASLAALEQQPSLGGPLDRFWTKEMDRTQFSLSVWFPFVSGDHGEKSAWPNSPPLFAPYAGDGVCEVSRGENSLNSNGDCPVTCGDGVQQAGETTLNCPGDCPLPS